MLRVINRVVVGLAGAALVALGLGVLLAGLGLPGFLPVDGPDDVLISDADRERVSSYGWWWPTVIAVLSVVVLLGLWWLAAQLRQRRLGEVVIDTGEPESGTGPRALLRGRALEDVLAAEATGIDGVERASVSLLGRRTAPRAHVGLVLGPRASPAATVVALRSRMLREACESTGLPALPTEVRLRAVKHRPERVT
ncbi:alkaline shock response membrane anchor protein AmaP [Streptomyces sp. A7024]|uniref:Alkaline shock response membrane anchor protein AmaP n=1 Tax=Streptomyces coryli TaxID=1128680 RepID=A0A6G4TXH3_9ACTN|nr:alkaline shock response membrane anchor protein AmaP [Streptomyces coryli]NGN64220.1 alkaline shock response membrane anchor protein AmaP [Streptomyces coryli]